MRRDHAGRRPTTAGRPGAGRPTTAGRPGARRPLRGLSVGLLGALVLVAACSGSSEGSDDGGTDAGAAEAATAEWPRMGGDLANTRAVTAEVGVDLDNVADLEPAWELADVLGVSATPVIDDGTLYVGDWTGHLRALDATTGDERWAAEVSPSYVGGAAALDDDDVYVGTFDARIVAIDRDSGETVWEASVGDHPKAVIFGSPVVTDGQLVVGVGSFEVFAPGDPPDFRGSIVSLDTATGEEQWRFHVTKGDETEGAGVSVWSSPAVDTERGALYIGTGQAYVQPAPPRSDALVALDLATGEELWSTQFTEGDAWTITEPTGLDADVGAAPNLLTVDGVDAVGVGDKAGSYRALDRETGEVLWEAFLTDGGTQGGVMASAAVADDTVFVTSNDASQDADFVALDAATGEERWRVDLGAHVTGPVTWADGVLYVSDDSGRIAAYDPADGARVWSHDVASPAAGGVVVLDGMVYAGWGWWLSAPPDDPEGGLTAFTVGDGGSGDDGDDDGADDGDDGDALMSGPEVYETKCATCHGGDGRGGSGPSLEGVDERLTLEEHREVVLDGRRAMPGWEGELAPEEIEAVIEYQRTTLSG